ncbi:LamG-like jellyroll fold domain-containing protein [Bacteroides sp.]|uniref:LamG-like jellyroll fold domain-containing protein n=1 Tax=Bacteroides sp. TaxID=29523 RepID=UPI0025BAB64B|nr:LamG-like jellyroll fold domain-containing protein [Bacteroides sp.]
MKKFLSFFVGLLCGVSALTVSAQTVNYALKNAEGTGYVEISVIKELNNSSEVTFQAWIKPEALSANAQLFYQDNLSLHLDAAGKLVVTSGKQSVTLNSYTFSLGQWAQVSVCVANGTVKVYINNVDYSDAISGTLPATLTVASERAGFIGKGFKGELDEIRIWNKALGQEELYWRNTLNKFNPNYESLVAYWKGDQDLCKNLVDYKLAYHGTFHSVSRVPVTDNAEFRYRISTGYTNLIRFIDRPNIDRDMFLMTNDLIILTAKVQKDGSLKTEYADNSAEAVNVGYLEEFEGRKGIMDFQGAGAGMTAADGDLFYSSGSGFGRDPVGVGTLEGWIYIDSWTEGALLFSKRKSETECIEVRLGNEATKDIVVDLNGTVGTLSNKVEIGKWHYLSVYFSPSVVEDISNPRLSFNIIQIGVDYTIFNGLSGVKLSGNSMNISTIPVLEGTPVVLGKNLDGKMDEWMVWGSGRAGSVENDATNPYKLNVGEWNNIFLNAYWKGDDPDHIGKDSQSFTGMIDFMRDYYANHRGMKIRMGLIYPEGDKWSGVLNKKENVDRLIADTKKLLPYFDGVDVDLEWHYYNILNPVIRRLIDEVMAGEDNKIFSVSQHDYSYTLDKSLLTDPGIDYFTMQLYGPQTSTYTWDYYEAAYKHFINYGYPKDKLVLSYGVLLVDGSEAGYKDLFEKLGMNDDNYDPDLNIWKDRYYFNGVNQVKRKQNFILDHDCLGTMYFDMANDLRVSDYKSLIRAQNDIIASNVDTLITQVKTGPVVGIQQLKNSTSDLCSIMCSGNDTGFVVVLADGISHAVCNIYSDSGVLCRQEMLNQKETTIEWGEMTKGIYLIYVNDGNRSESIKLYK